MATEEANHDAVAALAEEKPTEDPATNDTQGPTSTETKAASATEPSSTEAKLVPEDSKPTTENAEPNTTAPNGTDGLPAKEDSQKESRSDELRHRDWREKRDTDRRSHRHGRSPSTSRSPSRSRSHSRHRHHRRRHHSRSRSRSPHHHHHHHSKRHNREHNHTQNNRARGHGRGRGRGNFSGQRDNYKSSFTSLPESSDPDEIRKQVEFYFSDSNLLTDTFLLRQVNGSENNPVAVKTIHDFKRMRRFQPYSAVVAALKDSTTLTITDDDCIVRKTPLPAHVKPHAAENISIWEDATRPRSIYAKGFGDEKPSTQVDVEAFFAPYGPIRAVRLRRHMPERTFKGSVFVEFEDEGLAKQFLELEGKPKWEGRDLVVKSKEEYVKEKAEDVRTGKIRGNEGDRGPFRGRGRGGRARGGRGRGDGREGHFRGERQGREKRKRSPSEGDDDDDKAEAEARDEKRKRSSSPSSEDHGEKPAGEGDTVAGADPPSKKRGREEADLDDDKEEETSAGAETAKKSKTEE